MSMSMSLESESLLDIAIENNDVIAVEKCLLEGATITLQSIHKFSPKMSFTSSIYYDFGQPDQSCHKKIFELLLKYGFDIITNDIRFMMYCFKYCDEYYIQAISDAGFNGFHDKSVEMLRDVISGWDMTDDHHNKLRILLGNGFSRHIQSLLMRCITKTDISCISLFIEYGANCYSILHDLHMHVSQLQPVNSWIQNNIMFVLRNVYNITMLKTPIFKYLLIKSIPRNFDIPIEIFVHIFQLYMAMDYACSNKIKEMAVIDNQGMVVIDNQILPLVPANEYVN